MINYCLMLTFKCNWFCDFCATDTHTKPEVTFKDIKNKLNIVQNNSEVSISGGEPGLISKDRMKYIISELKKKNAIININTNGTFFKNFSEYHNDIDSYFYHCSEKLDNKVEMLPFDNIDYMIVVTNDTFPNLEKFLKINEHIKYFHIFGADKYQVNGKPGKFLSKINSLKIYTKFKNRIDPESYHYLLERCTVVNKELITI